MVFGFLVLVTLAQGIGARWRENIVRKGNRHNALGSEALRECLRTTAKGKKAVFANCPPYYEFCEFIHDARRAKQGLGEKAKD